MFLLWKPYGTFPRQQIAGGELRKRIILLMNQFSVKYMCGREKFVVGVIFSTLRRPQSVHKETM